MHELPVYERLGTLVPDPWFCRITTGDYGAAPLASSPLAVAAQHAFYRSFYDMSDVAIDSNQPEFEDCTGFDTNDTQNKESLKTIFKATRTAIQYVHRRERAAAAFVSVEEETENDDKNAIYSELVNFALILAPYLSENESKQSIVEARLVDIAEEVDRKSGESAKSGGGGE